MNHTNPSELFETYKNRRGALTKVIALIALAGMVQTSQASLTWNFATGPSSVSVGSSSKSYSDTTSTASITATGYNANNTTHNLYEKWSGSLNNSETGLGLDGTADHEIGVGQYIQLDFSSLSKSLYDNLVINIGSVQNGEGYAIYGNTSAGTPGTQLTLGSGGNTDSYTVSSSDWSTYSFFSVVGKTAGDVLLMNGLTLSQRPTSSVPEPTTVVAGALLLLPFGFSTLRMLRNRKQTA